MIFRAGAGKAGDQLPEDARPQLAGADVIEEEKRLRAEHGDVVDAMIDQILPDRVMAIHGKGDFQLGADAIHAGNEDRVAEFFDIQREQSAEPADLAEDLAAAGGSEQLRQGGLDPVAQVNIDSRRRVSFLTHAPARYPAPALVTSFQPEPKSSPQETVINEGSNLTGSFGGWRRCSLVTDPCGYAPRSRLAGRQNTYVILPP